jgi:hypothetical protein
MPDWHLRQCADLRHLARQLGEHLPATKAHLHAWRAELRRIESGIGLSDVDGEQHLDRLATRLRRICLQIAHRYADRVYRSPPDHIVPLTAEEQPLDFGYERELEPVNLEQRARHAGQISAAWQESQVLFSSGQAALNAILMTLTSTFRGSAPYRLAHLGSYFETTALLDLLHQTGSLQAVGRYDDAATPELSAPLDVLLVEPTHCTPSGEFAIEDIRKAVDWAGASPLAATKIVLVDTTLCGHRFPLADFLRILQEREKPPVVILYRSGLKLDQAGLELANVGIVSLYGTARSSVACAEIDATLRQIRSLAGGGLGFEQINALTVPWFLDRGYQAQYAQAVFDSNAALAAAFPSSDWLQLSHPSLIDDSQVAPFATLRLINGSSEDLLALEKLIGVECGRREIQLQEGGSFGFRGHRYQAIMPTNGDNAPYIRIAMGARQDASHAAFCALLAEVAGDRTIARTFERRAAAPASH